MDSDDEIPTLIEHENGVLPAAEPEVVSSSRVPVTIISGFLGAGKSTLLRRILTERHGHRIAVIMNEFGDTADIETRAIQVASADDPVAESSEEFLELANGCLCCSIKDSGVAAIEKLMERKGAFDYILLETTGLADPAPIASMFWQNEDFARGLGKDIVLDGVVCVVDAVFGRKQIEEDHSDDGIGECLRQIASADVVLLNKVDLVSQDELRDTEDLLHKINPMAQVIRTMRSDVDIDCVIGIGAYANRPFLPSSSCDSHHREADEAHDHSHHGDAHEHEHEHELTHYEIRGITSLQVTCPVLSPARLAKLDEWIRAVLWESQLPGGSGANAPSLDVLRCKGLFSLEGGQKHVLQGVRSIYEIRPLDGEEMGVPEEGKLVLIGKGLDQAVRTSLMQVFQ